MWEGRYKFCLEDSETYVLSCYRRIELNPVRARMIDDPAQFLWSSCAANCGHRDDPLLIPHAAYTTLSSMPAERASAYQTLLRETLSEDDLHDIRIYLQQQRALGHNDFRAKVEAKTCRFAGKMRNAANVTVIVPHPKKDLGKGLLAAILKQAGL